jgi:hypothetical protein
MMREQEGGCRTLAEMLKRKRKGEVSASAGRERCDARTAEHRA